MQIEAIGERVFEDAYLASPSRYLIYLFHIVTYKFAIPYVQGKRVLDYGCGSGYGTHALAPYCSEIIGADIAPDAIQYASSHYNAANLRYQCIQSANEAALPFPDGSFDTVLSFQVIEHIPDTFHYLSEIERILKPGGTFVCSTPDRSTRLLPLQKPWNIWHIREYNDIEFQKMMNSVFSEVDVLKMGGTPSVLAPELRRTQLAKWLTLPFTLPLVPEFFRLAGLRFIKKLQAANLRSDVDHQKPYDFGEDDLQISRDANPSVNLIAISRKS